MRTTIDIDEKLLKEAMVLTGAKTKKDLIHLSLGELIRQKRSERLIRKLGRFQLSLTLSDLEKMRANE